MKFLTVIKDNVIVSFSILISAIVETACMIFNRDENRLMGVPDNHRQPKLATRPLRGL